MEITLAPGLRRLQTDQLCHLVGIQTVANDPERASHHGIWSTLDGIKISFGHPPSLPDAEARACRTDHAVVGVLLGDGDVRTVRLHIVQHVPVGDVRAAIEKRRILLLRALCEQSRNRVAVSLEDVVVGTQIRRGLP